MNRERLNTAIAALNSKQVTQPCPRCSSSNFSIVGESEISVVQPPPPQGMVGRTGGLSGLPTKTIMPTIVVACDNCGYIVQHAQAALGLTPMAGLGLRNLREK